MSLSRLQSRLALPAALLAGMLTIAAPAQADIGETIIQRCTHAQSLGGFSQGAYAKALKELSATAEEYTNCASLIRAAQLAAAGAHGSGGGAGAESPVALAASPAEQRALTHARKVIPGPVSFGGGQIIQPGVVHANVSSALSSLPTPLLATLAFLLACLALVAGGTVRNRFRGQRPD